MASVGGLTARCLAPHLVRRTPGAQAASASARALEFTCPLSSVVVPSVSSLFEIRRGPQTQ